jgi:site-specific DNA-cytosine methylase
MIGIRTTLHPILFLSKRLSPIELERLNMFPDDHTKLEGVSDTKRAFFMGNALVVGVIEKIWNCFK